MPALFNLAGRKVGRLMVIERAGVTTTGKVTWRCSCACGETSVACGSDLKSGHTTSCGCARDERNRTSALSHGLRRSPTYSTWTAMKARCSNQNVKGYANYGGRGVTVCARWTDSFQSFVADMGERPPRTSLDRWPDAHGNYEPSNCRWATAKEQANNTTVNVCVTFRGETLTQAQWAERIGIKQSTLSRRLRTGWTAEQALTVVPRLGFKRVPRTHDSNGRFASKFGEEVEIP